MTNPIVIRRGTPAFFRANIAFFLSAFAIFASLYSVQPLLPIFAAEFDLGAGPASLALSVTTATLAIALLFASWVADRLGRKTLMVWAILLTSALGLLLPFAPNWWSLILIRTVMGLTLSGLPAVAMVYLAEEIEPEALGFSMGLYIGGTAIGGMAGRLLSGVLADWFGWRPALLVLGIAIAVAAVAVVLLLPTPRNSTRIRIGMRDLARLIRLQFNDAGLPCLFASAFLLMGSFVTLYNYAGFRLALPPFELSHAAIATIFVVYLLGSVSSAWAGGLAQRLGRRKVYWTLVLTMTLGVFLTLIPSTPVIIAGLAVATIGYFAAHGIASAWVARRAQVGRAQASAIYLFA
jgi:MFS transporter, YNFM family, putative membrane transport protein